MKYAIIFRHYYVGKGWGEWSQQAEDAAGRNYSSNPIRYWDAVGETAKNYEKMDTRKYTDYNTTAAKAVGGKG